MCTQEIQRDGNIQVTRNPFAGKSREEKLKIYYQYTIDIYYKPDYVVAPVKTKILEELRKLNGEI